MSALNTVSGIKERATVDLDLAAAAYTDSEWDSLLERSVIRINRKLALTGNDGELTLAAGTYTRDDAVAVSDSIGDIVLLQTECIIAKSLRRAAVSKGIRVKDGDSSIDTTASFPGHDNIVTDICQELESAIVGYRASDPDGEAGAGTFGDIITYDNSPIDMAQDHNGQTFGDRDYSSPFDSSGDAVGP
jgi:hypothetical protein